MVSRALSKDGSKNAFAANCNSIAWFSMGSLEDVAASCVLAVSCRTCTLRVLSKLNSIDVWTGICFNRGDCCLLTFQVLTEISLPFPLASVGDVHGDLLQTWRILTACGVLREGDNGEAIWCGGDTIFVQCGDILDRGDHEIAIVVLLRELHHQAVEQGGAVYILNGNHESLNVCGDFRYVTAGGFVESSVCAGYDMVDVDGSWEGHLRSRVGLFRPGGPLARELAHNHTVLVINDTVFVHGGLLPEHVEYGLEKLNQDVTDWMLGKLDSTGHFCGLPELAAGGQTSVMWNRAYSREYYPSLQDRLRACSLLEDTLKKVGCKRLVVGHTPQTRGINGECGGKVWRVDTGLSRGVLGGAVEGLEILPPHQQSGDIAVRIIKEM